MKNIIFICLGLAAVLLLCIYLPADSKEARELQSEDVTVSNQYTVKEYEGQVAVFSDDSELPVKVFDTCVSTLPKCDREKLKTGITVATPEELQRIIEDLTG